MTPDRFSFQRTVKKKKKKKISFSCVSSLCCVHFSWLTVYLRPQFVSVSYCVILLARFIVFNNNLNPIQSEHIILSFFFVVVIVS